MDLVTLGRTLGFSFAAGVNLYATVAILGLAARYGWVDLPPQFQAFNNPLIIGTAIVLYLVEFFADKIPYFDSLWDILHTAIRPLGGALIAVTTLGDASPGVEGLVALLGGTVAAGSHLTKTSTRAVANTSPEPASERKRRHPTVREHLVIAVAGIGDEVAGVQREARTERTDWRSAIQKREASVRERTRQSIE